MELVVAGFVIYVLARVLFILFDDEPRFTGTDAPPPKDKEKCRSKIK